MKGLLSILCAAVIALGSAAAPAHAQPTKDQLKSQFRAREPELKDLKKQGKVGETIEGLVEAVDPAASADEKASKLVTDENNDRRALYRILADEINKESPAEKVKATAETVASRNAQRNFERARPEEMVRVAKDHWIRAGDLPRYQKISALKAQGRVGETAAGLVEAVKPEDRNDKALAALVDEENAVRNAEYKAAAQKEHIDAAAVAKKRARRNFDNAKVGEMLKDESGSWRKK